MRRMRIRGRRRDYILNNGFLVIDCNAIDWIAMRCERLQSLRIEVFGMQRSCGIASMYTCRYID
eukprot:2684585-Pyramimonas_sp.AAC.1